MLELHWWEQIWCLSQGTKVWFQHEEYCCRWSTASEWYDGSYLGISRRTLRITIIYGWLWETTRWKRCLHVHQQAHTRGVWRSTWEGHVEQDGTFSTTFTRQIRICKSWDSDTTQCSVDWDVRCYAERYFLSAGRRAMWRRRLNVSILSSYVFRVYGTNSHRLDPITWLRSTFWERLRLPEATKVWRLDILTWQNLDPLLTGLTTMDAFILLFSAPSTTEAAPCSSCTNFTSSTGVRRWDADEF